MMLTATLPLPPGINDTSRAGIKYVGKRPVPYVYTSHVARAWKETSVLALRDGGWPELPPTKGRYWVSVAALLHSNKHDVDASDKLITDTVSATIGINDARFSHVGPVRIATTTGEGEFVLLRVHVLHTPDREVWNVLSRSLWDTDYVSTALRDHPLISSGLVGDMAS